MGDDVLLEDELWNRIRLSPNTLPTGELRLLPGTIFQRFSHRAWGSRAATARLDNDPDNPALRVYTVTYEDVGRTL